MNQEIINTSINTKLLLSLLNLNKHQLKEFISFISVFKNLKLEWENKFSNSSDTQNDKFIKIVETLAKHQHKVVLSSEKRMIKKSNCFIGKYYEILKNLISNSSLKDFDEYFCGEDYNNRKTKIIKTISYILNNFDNKDIMIENVNRLNSIGIKQFNFDVELELDKEYKFTKLNDIYPNSGVITDGNKLFKYSSEQYVYPFDLTDANFTIEYYNISTLEAKIEAKAKSLIFPSRLLPETKEEFMEDIYQVVLPYNFYEQMQDEINKLICYKDVLEEYKNKLKSIKIALGTYEDSLSSVQLSDYQKNIIKITKMLKKDYEKCYSEAIAKTNLSNKEIDLLLKK